MLEISADRRVPVEVPELTTIPDYVRVGLGVVPDVEPATAPGVTQLPIAGTDLAWTLSVVTLSGQRPSRAVTALLDLISDSIPPASRTSKPGSVGGSL